MLGTTALLIPLAGGLISLPSDTDHLIGGGGKGRAVLTLDASCSMGGGDLANQNCPDVYGCVACTLDKNQMLIGAALGCVSGVDGIFDRWASKVDFSIVGFGYSSDPRVRLLHAFSNNVASLEASVSTLPVQSGTPLQYAVNFSGRQHNLNWALGPGVDECDQFHLVILSDGNPNSPSSPAYDYACDGTRIDFPSNTNIAQGTAYLADNPIVCGVNDNPVTTYAIAFGAPGSFNMSILQNAATSGDGDYHYASDTQRLSTVFDDILQSIVTRNALFFANPSIQSDGLFYGNYIYVPSFRPRTKGVWQGNLKKYCVEPPKNADGNFTMGEDCLFMSKQVITTNLDHNRVLVTNPAPFDQWSSSTSIETTVGGAGERMFAAGGPFSGSAPLDDVTGWANHYDKRNVLTWKPGTSGYKAANPTTMSEDESFSSGCERYQLFAFLHGYEVETVDCGVFAPTEISEWPMGPMINSPAAVLRYNATPDICETTANTCFVAVGADDGMVHFFDAFNGREVAGIVPGDLWVPGTVATYRLAEVINQPDINYVRKEYVGGGLTLYHEDNNANGAIDGGEEAILIYALGKGGNAVYFMDARTKPNFGSTASLNANNPVYPLVNTPGTWADDLRNVISTPRVGRSRFPSTGANVKEYIALTSGHVWASDIPEAALPDAAPVGAGVGYDGAKGVSCASFSSYNSMPPEFCDPAPASGSLEYCQMVNGFPGCDIGPASGNLGSAVDGECDVFECAATGKCNWPTGIMFLGCDRNSDGQCRVADGECGPASAAPLSVHYDIYLGPPGMDQTYCPLSYDDAASVGQLTFETLQLDHPDGPDRIAGNADDVVGDFLYIEDTAGNTIAGPFTGNCTNGECGQPAGDFTIDFWAGATTLGAAEFCVHFVTDGVASEPTSGIKVKTSATGTGKCPDNDTGAICYIKKQAAGGGANCGVPGGNVANCGGSNAGSGCPCAGAHDPFLAILDVDKLNGPGRVSFADEVTDGSQLLLVTRSCNGAANCIDSSTYGTLANMNCPISAPPAIYEEGGITRGFYFGDECGKVWRIWTNNNGASWIPSVILDVNETWTAAAIMENQWFRKIFRRVDLVINRCNGSRNIGVYFGTGNLQRPSALAPGLNQAPGDPAFAQNVTQYYRGRDVVGVVMDDCSIGSLNCNGTPGTGAVTLVEDASGTATGNILTDASVNANLNSKAVGFRGWFWPLALNERMLRDPITIEGITFFKTYQPLTEPTQCTPGTGLDRVYGVNNCTAKPVTDQNSDGNPDASDREIWSGEQDVGGDVFVYAGKDGTLNVSAGADNSNAATEGLLPPAPPGTRGFRLFLYRHPRDD